MKPIAKGLTCALLAAGVGLSCGEEPRPEPIRPVRSMAVGDEASFTARWWPGRAKATLEVDLGFEVSGQLIERSADVGDEVKAGTVMARLDARDYENALLRAKAERDRAKANYGRLAEAAKTGAVSRQELDDGRARYNQAEAQVAIRQKAVDDTRIVAPFDGIVSQTYVDNFQNVRVKQPVIRLLDVSRIEMVINIPEDRINLAPYIQEVRVRFDALPGVEIPATIREIGNEASEATRTYPVTLSMDPARQGAEVKPGMAGEATARVELPDELREVGIEVPQSALLAPDGAPAQETFVWVVDEETQTVHRRKVVPGQLTVRGGTLVQGLEPGERIVTAGVHSLREGQKVRIQ
jgi:RND family efflux transporter MFP subunit